MKWGFWGTETTSDVFLMGLKRRHVKGVFKGGTYPYSIFRWVTIPHPTPPPPNLYFWFQFVNLYFHWFIFYCTMETGMAICSFERLCTYYCCKLKAYYDTPRFHIEVVLKNFKLNFLHLFVDSLLQEVHFPKGIKQKSLHFSMWNYKRNFHIKLHRWDLI